MAREDARAREQATLELVQDETLVAEQQEAERTRAADNLAGRPHLAHALAERRRLAQEQAAAAQRAQAERADRLARGVAAVRAALGTDDLNEAGRLLAHLRREFPQEQEVQRLADVARWRERQRLVERHGWCQSYRYTPATSRGVVFARRTLDRPFEVVSVLGLGEWRPGQVVTEPLPRGARELQVG
jgi:hypothetical protein